MSDVADRLAAFGKTLSAPDDVFRHIEPGMSIFLSTDPGEPRTLVRHLLKSGLGNLRDLELIHIVSLGDVLTLQSLEESRFRLKTFFASSLANDALTQGRIDFIPAAFSTIPSLIQGGAVRVDAAFVQISPPDTSGYASFGVVVDAARAAIERASLVVAEVNPAAPRTLGDSFIHVSEIDYFVEAEVRPFYFFRWEPDETFDKVARNVATLIENGSCLGWSIGPMFDALGRHLREKRDLGLHSLMLTDAVMDLIKSGAVTNRRKRLFRGKTVASWVLGAAELHAWLDRNPLIEMQGIDVTASPEIIGQLERFVAAVQIRKVDLTGRVALHTGKGNVAAGPSEVVEQLVGARLSKGGKTLAALPSRNRAGQSNIVLTTDGLPNVIPNRESFDFVVTEYGAAYLAGRTLRERAQALIDVAHPDDRASLVESAKAAGILYKDQIFFADSGRLYPAEVATTRTFKDGLEVRFRAIRPSDEEEMRRLFYRFSDEGVYYRYFSRLKTMPHKKMQAYTTVDYRTTMSIVAVIGEPGTDHLIGEARYVQLPGSKYADFALLVDDAYQGKGVASFMFLYLIQLAKERGLEGLSASVLATNKRVLRILEKSPHPIQARVESGVYELVIPFDRAASGSGSKLVFTRN